MGDIEALNALKERLQAKEEEMHHYKEQEEGLVHVLHMELDTLKKRDKEQGEILLELESKLLQAGVSMNATSVLLRNLHKERREYAFPNSQHLLLMLLIVILAAALGYILRKRGVLGRWTRKNLSGLSLPSKEKDEA